MNVGQLVKIIQSALMSELQVIECIEADNASIFLKVEDKIYLINIQERKPVNVSIRTFNPQPKPEGKRR